MECNFMIMCGRHIVDNQQQLTAWDDNKEESMNEGI